MSKINIRVTIGLALVINFFNYLGLRTVQWVWMNQNGYVNDYLPYLGFLRLDLGTFIFLILPEILPIALLILALALASNKKTALLLIVIAFVFRILAFILGVFYTTFSNIYEWPIDRSITHAIKYQVLGLSSFTLPLDLFSMFVTVGSSVALVLAAALIFQQIKEKKTN